MEVQILSPRMQCPCGKGIRKMTQEERHMYEDAKRRLETQRQQHAMDNVPQQMSVSDPFDVERITERRTDL